MILFNIQKQKRYILSTGYSKSLKKEPSLHRIMYKARGGGLFNFFKTSDQVSCYTF